MGRGNAQDGKELEEERQNKTNVEEEGKIRGYVPANREER
jgi:hypothetical protein